MTRRILTWALVIMGVVALKLILSQTSHPVAAAIHHLLFGFIDFMVRNGPRVSLNPDTAIPGLLAFLTAALIAHAHFRSWAAKHNRSWTLATTLALASTLPLLFAIAFLVPGILLQVRALANLAH